MSLVFVIVIIVVAYLIYDKINVDTKIGNAKAVLDGQRVSDKFKTVVKTISENNWMFKKYEIVNVRSFQDNIYSINHPNTVIIMRVFDGELNLEWKFQIKFLNKEVIKHFRHDISNFGTTEQVKFAKNACEVMRKEIFKLQGTEDFL